MQNEALHRTEAELDATLARYFALYDLAPVGYCTLSEEGLIVETNLIAATLLGVSRGVLFKQQFSRFILKEDQDIYHLHRKQLLETGGPRPCELRMVKMGGAVFWGHLVTTAVREADGEYVYRVALSDITERREKDKTIQENELKLRLALDAAELGTWELDIATNQLLWSEKTKAMFGLRADAAITRELFFSLLHPDDQDKIRSAVWHAIEHDKKYHHEMRVILRDRAVRWIESTGELFLGENGKPIRMLGVMRDVTESRQAQIQLEEKTARLEEVNRELEAFSYSISHDLQGPVRVMDGFAKMVLKDYEDRMDPEVRQKFEVIRENAKVMGDLIEGLLDLSRIGRKEPSLSLLDIRELFEKVWNELQTAHPGRNFEFIREGLAPAFGDHTLIRQVLYNLVSNAVKFTGHRRKAVIKVGSYPEGGHIVYYVKDNGAGFDMKYSDRLFGVFHRLHSASAFQGTGIGLAIVYRIVKRHGGRVWAEGKVNKGACFYFSLPAGK